MEKTEVKATIRTVITLAGELYGNTTNEAILSARLYPKTKYLLRDLAKQALSEQKGYEEADLDYRKENGERKGEDFIINPTDSEGKLTEAFVKYNDAMGVILDTETTIGVPTELTLQKVLDEEVKHKGSMDALFDILELAEQKRNEKTNHITPTPAI